MVSGRRCLPDGRLADAAYGRRRLADATSGRRHLPEGRLPDVASARRLPADSVWQRAVWQTAIWQRTVWQTGLCQLVSGRRRLPDAICRLPDGRLADAVYGRRCLADATSARGPSARHGIWQRTICQTPTGRGLSARHPSGHLADGRWRLPDTIWQRAVYQTPSARWPSARQRLLDGVCQTPRARRPSARRRVCQTALCQTAIW